MKLNSVRELKHVAIKQLLPEFAGERRAIGAFGVEASPTKRIEPFLRSTALGVAVGREPGDYVLALRVQAHGVEGHAAVERVVAEAHGEVDVRYIGRVTKRNAWYRSRQRPLLIGSSIGHVDITAGTLGAFVHDTENERPLILSNNHVLANENKGVQGDSILQPGTFDGGGPGDRVGVLDSFVALQGRGVNTVDCATATIDEGVEFEAGTLKDVGQLGTPLDDIPEEEDVEKIGRTTGHTLGRISAFEVDNVIVDYDMGPVRFDGQIEIESTGTGPFSAGGDSGSLIYTSGGAQPFALLFAGSDTGGANGLGVTYANPLETVLRELNVALLS